MNSHRPTRKRGFTLVELLVVIAIIGVLVGMLLPAVQMVREAARRSTCLNNMRQLGMATHNYQSAHLKLPPGATAGPMTSTPDFSLHVLLLPYLEQTALYDQYIGNGLTPAQLSTQKVDIFLCASATQLDEIGGSTGADHNTTHYLGVSGPYDYNFTPTDPSQPYLVLTTSADGTVGQQGCFGANIKMTGVVGPASFSAAAAKSMADILDGTSNTMMFCENSRSQNPQLGYSPLRGGWAFGLDGERVHSVRTITGYRNTNDPEGEYNEEPFASNHPGGFNFTMADGSTKFVSENVDEVVVRSVASIGSKEVVTGFE